ncbi:cupredoxin domain-containing protein [Candidatus Woesearchaeota archaeon]|nr:cupredoxin domain-containing protein [Candidatus Woesearchaeota archaeon]
MKAIYAVLIISLFVLSACAANQQVATAQPSKDTVTAQKTIQQTVPIKKQVSILGKDGFNPRQVSISAGSSVTWVNNDNIELTLTIFKDGSFYRNSDIIAPGQKFELTFQEKGTYEYWSVAYDVKGYITVN